VIKAVRLLLPTTATMARLYRLYHTSDMNTHHEHSNKDNKDNKDMVTSPLSTDATQGPHLCRNSLNKTTHINLIKTIHSNLYRTTGKVLCHHRPLMPKLEHPLRDMFNLHPDRRLNNTNNTTCQYVLLSLNSLSNINKPLLNTINSNNMQT
jgi:hypothetical protein